MIKDEKTAPLTRNIGAKKLELRRETLVALRVRSAMQTGLYNPPPGYGGCVGKQSGKGSVNVQPV